jgi:CDP-glucose 4,6-dehydratase
VAAMDRGFWSGKRVLLTGHTGFKGSWAALWLSRMGAEITGMALPPDTNPNLYMLAGVEGDVRSKLLDVRDRDIVVRAVEECRPEIVLHMAAQSLVRRAARTPVETIATNVMGTVHLLDALRNTPGLQAVLVVTTDKVYRNDERRKAFTEEDALGGEEPYSASKAAVDIVARAFGDSYFEFRGISVATARGGNVLGGGDFAPDRLVPDIVRATLAGMPVLLRNPQSTRPWQHVLDCLAGYFRYLQALALGQDVPRALNFAPTRSIQHTVEEVADAVLSGMGNRRAWLRDENSSPAETDLLSLDAQLAHRSLQWADRYDGQRIIDLTAAWYREFTRGGDMRDFSLAQIDAFMRESATEQIADRCHIVDPARTSR